MHTPTWTQTGPASWRTSNPVSGDVYDIQDRGVEGVYLSGTAPSGIVYWIDPDGWPTPEDAQPTRYGNRAAAQDALTTHWQVVPGHGTPGPVRVHTFSAVERFAVALIEAIAMEAARILLRDKLAEGCSKEGMERYAAYACTPEGMERVWQGLLLGLGGVGWITLAGLKVTRVRYDGVVRHLCTPQGKVLLRKAIDGICIGGRAYAGTHTPTVSPRVETQFRVIEHTQKCGCAHAGHAEVIQRMADREAIGGARNPGVNAARMWKIAAQLYRDPNFPVLAIRECLQNSVDGIRKAGLKSGAGHFGVTWDPDARSGRGQGGTLTLTDNGAGMSAEIFTSKFMSLGDTGKADDPDAGGGFGVAKAAILAASRSWDWTIRSRDWIAESNPADGTYQLYKAPEMIEGVTTILRDVNTAEVDDKLLGAEVSVETAGINVLALSNLPGIRLTINGREVPPWFPGRRGSKVDQTFWWGEGNEVEVKTYKRSDDDGGFYVRLHGLYQFSESGISGLRADVTVDIHKARSRPEDPGYPLTPARDGFRGYASNAYYSLRRMLHQEASAGVTDDPEYDDYGGDEASFDAGSEGGSLLDDPDLLKEAHGILGSIEDLLREKVEGGTWKPPEVESTAPATIQSDPGKPTEYGSWRDLASAMPTSAAEATSEAGRATVAAGLAFVAEQAGVSINPSMLTDLTGGEAIPEGTADHLVWVLGQVNGAGGEDRGDSGGAAEALGISTLATAFSAILEASGVSSGMDWQGIREEEKKRRQRERAERIREKLKKETAALNPFGSGVMVKISRKNFEPNQRRAFKRNSRKYLPHLLAWEGVTKLLAREGKMLLPFRVGLLLDNTTRAMAVTQEKGGRKRRWVLINPLKLDDYVRAFPTNPAAVASYLYTLAAHELTHLPQAGTSHDGHGQHFITEREDLQMSTGHIVPALEGLVLRAFPKAFPTKTLYRGGIAQVQVAQEEARCAAAIERLKAAQAAALARRDSTIRELRRGQAAGLGNLAPALVAARSALDAVARQGAGLELAAWAGGPRGREVLGPDRAAMVARMLRDPKNAMVLPGVPLTAPKS